MQYFPRFSVKRIYYTPPRNNYTKITMHLKVSQCQKVTGSHDTVAKERITVKIDIDTVHWKSYCLISYY